MTRAASPDDLEPLREHCRTGRLFEVQEWLREGNPVALKVLPPPRKRRNGPLCIAMDRGFHSLVQVLLQAGAPMEEGNYHALQHAVELRRTDLVSLLLEHGATVEDVSMQCVIGTWDREMVDLFVSSGASLIRDNPIAWGLINKIRTTLGVLKRYVVEQPELMQQVDIALRYHAGEGSPKWVALTLWAGADPWTRGPDEAPDWDAPVYIDEDDEEYEPLYHNAIELAVMRSQIDVLGQKKLLPPPDPERPESQTVLERIWFLRDSRVLELLIERGHTPDLLADKGNSLITRLLCGMGFERPGSYGAQEQLNAIRILAAHGARWMPEDNEEIKRVRQSLLRVDPRCTLEFVGLMQEFNAARRCDAEELIRTAAIQRVLANKLKRVANLVAKLPEEPPTGPKRAR